MQLINVEKFHGGLRKVIIVNVKEREWRPKGNPKVRVAKGFFYMRALALLYITSPSCSSHCFLMKDGSP